MASRKKRRSAGGLALLLLAVVLLAGGALYWRYQRFASTPLTAVKAGTRISVQPGNAMPQFLRRLRQAGVVQGTDLEWQMLARQLGAAHRLQVGEYQLKPGMTPTRLLSDIRDGRVSAYRFTLVEGWNMRDLRRALAKAEPLVHTIATMDDTALMSALGSAGQYPEGRFLPETYIYTLGDSDIDVLRRAHASMQRALDRAWAGRVQGLPLKSPAELLTLASIVEKETGVANERPRVAGVFVRRLQKGMRLETDPTVIYGMGERYQGNIRRSDLQEATPYNTYVIPGLPPTPIAMPGKAALEAAAHPDASDALYFVAMGDGSGRSLYAATLQQHNANVQAYLARLRAARAAAPEATAPPPNALPASAAPPAPAAPPQ